MKKKLFSNSLFIPFLIIALSIAYYLVIYLPSREKEKRMDEEARSRAIIECTNKIKTSSSEFSNITGGENVSTVYNLLMKACLNKRGFKE